MHHRLPVPKVTPWSADHSPSERELVTSMQKQGLAPYSWSNGPHDRYSPHSHHYDKVLYVVSGSITFRMPDTGDAVELHPGDRLDLPAGITHDALVGPSGFEARDARK